MKFSYAYKTSDGQRHEATMEASSRDAVFAALRAQGIKAIKVVASDGSKANGAGSDSFFHTIKQVRPVLWYGIAAVVVGLAVLAFWLGRERANVEVEKIERRVEAAESALPFLTDRTRRQVIGDPAVIDKGIRTGWSEVFATEGERFLASFAIPGVKAGVRNTNVEALEEVLNHSTVQPSLSAAASAKAETSPVRRSLGEGGNLQPASIEAQQIRAMVEGMKDEARRYVAAGGTLVTYGQRLVERQDAEIAIATRIETEVVEAKKTLPEDEFVTFLESRNDELRNLGIRPVTIPE